MEKGSTKGGGWTIEEYLALVDKYPDVPVSINAHPDGFYIWLMYELSALTESFVDWDERTCSFESEAFVQTIEMLKSYAERCRRAEIDSPASLTTYADRLYKRQVQTQMVTFQFDTYFTQYREFKEAFLESYELASRPNLEGEVKYTMSGVQNGNVLYSMNAASAKKDAAWIFLEYMLSEYQETMAETGLEGFPARRDLVERLLQEEVEAEATDNYITKNRYTGEIMPKRGGFTEEEQVLYILDHAAPPSVPQRNGTFWEFFTDEMGAFLAGNKTATETAHIIQNRMTMYFNE